MKELVKKKGGVVCVVQWTGARDMEVGDGREKEEQERYMAGRGGGRPLYRWRKSSERWQGPRIPEKGNCPFGQAMPPFPEAGMPPEVILKLNIASTNSYIIASLIYLKAF